MSSRIRTRLCCERASQKELHQVLLHALDKAGNPALITDSLQEALADHAGGNYRSLMVTAGELLLAAFEGQQEVIDEKLFFELYGQGSGKKRKAGAR